MTVESELTEVKLKGLRRTTSKRVVDYRTVIDSSGPYPVSTPQRERMMLLSGDIYDATFAEATGENSVKVYSADLSTGLRSDPVTYVGPAIKEADLRRFDGLERWSWRETREGDYPEPASGQVITPVQTKLKLT